MVPIPRYGLIPSIKVRRRDEDAKIWTIERGTRVIRAGKRSFLAGDRWDSGGRREGLPSRETSLTVPDERRMDHRRFSGRSKRSVCCAGRPSASISRLHGRTAELIDIAKVRLGAAADGRQLLDRRDAQRRVCGKDVRPPPPPSRSGFLCFHDLQVEDARGPTAGP